VRTTNLLFRFENYQLDGDRRELRRDGQLVEMEPKVFDLLAYVIANRERVVSRDDLVATVWDGRIVSESALATCINAARMAIGDSGDKQRLIKTLPRKGIRFVGIVQQESKHYDTPVEAAPERTSRAFALPDRPSIAVLAFNNIGSDPEQEYFADGVVEDIISGLSRIKWLFVIARNSSFVYKGRPVDVKQVGRELGVRYVLEGSVRKAGNRVRITAQLIEAETGVHIWAERYDRLIDDVFALQDELTASAIGAIEPSLRKAEIDRVKRKRPENLDAYDFVLALPFTYGHIAEDADRAMPLLARALTIEPDYAAAHAALAWCYHFRFRLRLIAEDRAGALRHARAAIAHGADDPTALGIAGFVLALDEHDHAAALTAFDRALTLSNSNIFALCSSALVLSFMGRSQLAVERARSAIRLSPFDKLNYLSYNALAISYFCASLFEEAHDAARRSVQLNPRFYVCHLFLVAALVGLGRLDQAQREAQNVLALDPTFAIGRFAVTVGFEPVVFTPLAAAWEKAGLPK
jgi:TolB-like protein/Flp pilus assembly protein TadD